MPASRIRLASLLVGAVLVFSVSSASAQTDPTVAPPASVSADGRTVTAAGKTLSASQASGIAPGQPVTVSGSGFDPNKGVYLGLCVIPPPNTPPSPCGGGQDRSGASGSSEWISSNPPSYAVGLTQAYGPGGSFTVSLQLSPEISPGLDCKVVRCAIVTRNDHTRGSDRSQDLMLPVTFSDAAAAPPTTAAVPPPAPTTTAAPAPTTVEATTSSTSTTEPTTTTTSTTAVGDDEEQDDVALAASDDSTDGGSVAPVLAIGAVLLVVLAGVAWRTGVVDRLRKPAGSDG